MCVCMCVCNITVNLTPTIWLQLNYNQYKHNCVKKIILKCRSKHAAIMFWLQSDTMIRLPPNWGWFNHPLDMAILCFKMADQWVYNIYHSNNLISYITWNPLTYNELCISIFHRHSFRHFLMVLWLRRRPLGNVIITSVVKHILWVGRQLNTMGPMWWGINICWGNN